jgi:hypothetical protein
MFVLSGMGGAWVPLEFTGKAIQTIGHLLPSARALDGLETIVVRGLGLESVWLPAGIIAAYAVGLFALAAWRFRFKQGWQSLAPGGVAGAPYWWTWQ